MPHFNLPELLRAFVVCAKKKGSEQCVGSEQSQQAVSSLFFKTASKAAKYACQAEH